MSMYSKRASERYHLLHQHITRRYSREQRNQSVESFNCFLHRSHACVGVGISAFCFCFCILGRSISNTSLIAFDASLISSKLNRQINSSVSDRQITMQFLTIHQPLKFQNKTANYSFKQKLTIASTLHYHCAAAMNLSS